MAGSTGPDIVTDGLVFAVDAANKKSYPGSGTTWTDLSGNGYDGTLTNDPTFNSSNGGSIVFDGTDDYVVKTGVTYTPYCVDIWFYNDDIVEPDVVMEGGFQQLLGLGDKPAGVTMGAWTGNMTNETISFWGVNYQSTGATYIRDTISVGTHNLVFNWNGSNYDIWLDGSKKTTYAINTYGHCTLHQRDSIYIGKEDGNVSYEFDGKVYTLKIYTSSKTDTQVLQNYNATKSRFI